VSQPAEEKPEKVPKVIESSYQLKDIVMWSTSTQYLWDSQPKKKKEYVPEGEVGSEDDDDDEDDEGWLSHKLTFQREEMKARVIDCCCCCCCCCVECYG